MKKIKAILFDLDGTLINSEIIHFECWNEILKAYNIQLDYDHWLNNYAGIPLPVKAQKIVSSHDLKVAPAELIAKKEQITIERLRNENVDMMPFATEVLDYFNANKITMALVTASSKVDTEMIFTGNRLAKYFKVIITRNDVNNSKPDPECYNVCLERLGVCKEECVVFEDTLNGVRAAKAADVLCFAIQNNIIMHNDLQTADALFLNLKEAKEHLIRYYSLS